MGDHLDPNSLSALPHETPYFLFSRERIESNVREFQRLFPGSQIQYAMKANAEADVLRTVAEASAGFEVASVHELALLKSQRIAPERIIYGTPVKPAAQIKQFAEYGVDRFAVDSSPEVEKVASVAPGARVYVRMCVDDTGSVYRFSEKFGAKAENVVRLLEQAKDLGLRPYGISFHVGSQARNRAAWANAIHSIGPLLEQLNALKIKLEILNIGGGFPCQYASTTCEPNLSEIATETMNQYDQLPYKPELMLEPGRGVVASAGVLVTSVIARVERSRYTWLFLDAGVYNGLFETMAYQGSIRYRVSSVRASYDAGDATFALAGPTGDSPDVITREASLPKDMDVGDKLVFHDVGAYSTATCCPFNGFPRPSIYYAGSESASRIEFSGPCGGKG
jgi:ornithine decarboxylase